MCACFSEPNRNTIWFLRLSWEIINSVAENALVKICFDTFFCLCSELLHDVNVLGLSVVYLDLLSSCSSAAYWQFYETVLLSVAVMRELVFFSEHLNMEVFHIKNGRSDKGCWSKAVDRCFCGSVLVLCSHKILEGYMSNLSEVFT